MSANYNAMTTALSGAGMDKMLPDGVDINITTIGDVVPEPAVFTTVTGTTITATTGFVGATTGALNGTLGQTTPAVATVTSLNATGYIEGSVGNALTAVGTNRATALQLAKQVNNITTAASGTGALLPVGVIGMRITVFNAGANAIQVYATASETIDGVAGSTGVPLTNAKRCDYFFTAANTWISAQLGVVSA